MKRLLQRLLDMESVGPVLVFTIICAIFLAAIMIYIFANLPWDEISAWMMRPVSEVKVGHLLLCILFIVAVFGSSKS